MYSFRPRSSSSSVALVSSISLARVSLPRRFFGDGGIGGGVSGEICMRLVLVFLFAVGKVLLCSPGELGMELLFAPWGLVFLAGLPAGGVASVGYVVPGFFAEESRLVFPGGDGEAVASSALRNKVLQPCPCCSGAHSDAGARSGWVGGASCSRQGAPVLV